MNRYLPLLILLCFNPPPLPAQEAQTQASFETGIVINPVPCTKSPGQNYALYLPKAYTPAHTWPILYIFDPAARAELAVNRFRAAAEQMNWILACSNNARNGPWEDILAAADAVLLDTQEKLSVDYEQVYTAGFSGGSRAAMAIAVITGKVAGVIGCGAVFPSAPEYTPGPQTAKFRYVGMVGLQDMNYLEHEAAEQHLAEVGIDNHLVLFNAGHEWPPSEKAVQAVQWLVLKQQAEEAAPDEMLLRQYRDTILAEAASFFQDEYPMLAVHTLENFKADFGAFADNEPVDALIQQSVNNQRYRKQLKAHRKVKHKEAALQQKYISAFVELYWTVTENSIPKDQQEWWEIQVNYLKKQTQQPDKLKRNSAYRLLNLISARSTESCFNFLSQGDYPRAIALNKLWLQTNPEDVYANWQMAKIHALMGNKNQALDYLEHAVEYGMRFKKSLKEPAFEGLKEEQRYQNLVKAMEQQGR